MNNYKLKVFIFFGIAVGFSVMFFYNPTILSDGMKNGLYLCGNTIVPSLFPFMVVSEFLVLSGVGSAVGEKMSIFTKLFFNLSGCTSCVILMSMLGGFPVGARMTARLVEENYISKRQGRRMLLFCMNCGPAFSVSVVGTAMLNNKKVGIIIYVSLVLSALIIGFVTRFFGKSETSISIYTKGEINGGAIVESVKNSVGAMLSICAWVVLFSCVGGCIELLPLGARLKAIVFSVFEVTNGCDKMSKAFPPFLIAGVIGWSGLAVHCQVYEYIKICEMPFAKFLIGRISSSAVATAICCLLLKLFHCETAVFSLSSNVVAQPYSVSLPSAVAVIVLALFLIADNDLARNDRI